MLYLPYYLLYSTSLLYDVSAAMMRVGMGMGMVGMVIMMVVVVMVLRPGLFWVRFFLLEGGMGDRGGGEADIKGMLAHWAHCAKQKKEKEKGRKGKGRKGREGGKAGLNETANLRDTIPYSYHRCCCRRYEVYDSSRKYAYERRRFTSSFKGLC